VGKGWTNINLTVGVNIGLGINEVFGERSCTSATYAEVNFYIAWQLSSFDIIKQGLVIMKKA